MLVSKLRHCQHNNRKVIEYSNTFPLKEQKENKGKQVEK